MQAVEWLIAKVWSSFSRTPLFSSPGCPPLCLWLYLLISLSLCCGFCSSYGCWHCYSCRRCHLLRERRRGVQSMCLLYQSSFIHLSGLLVWWGWLHWFWAWTCDLVMAVYLASYLTACLEHDQLFTRFPSVTRFDTSVAAAFVCVLIANNVNYLCITVWGLLLARCHVASPWRLSVVVAGAVFATDFAIAQRRVLFILLDSKLKTYGTALNAI